MNPNIEKLTHHTVVLARTLENSLQFKNSSQPSEDASLEQKIDYIMSVAVAVRDYPHDQSSSDTKYEIDRVLKNLEKLLYFLELHSGGVEISKSEEGLLSDLASTSLHLLTRTRKRE